MNIGKEKTSSLIIHHKVNAYKVYFAYVTEKTIFYRKEHPPRF